MENPGAAFVEIAVLWIAIVGTILAFVQVSTLAACLLLPYLAWVTFASYLNYKICRLNP
jgi:tryptophan-rich sensory protein